jgi:hypothetical protein
MAKQQTFADKLNKSSQTTTCPVCGDPKQPTMVLQPIPTDAGTYRMREVRIAVCKCNRKEVYG